MYNNIFVIYDDGEMGMVAWGIFLLYAGNLKRNDFDLLNLFQS